MTKNVNGNIIQEGDKVVWIAPDTNCDTEKIWDVHPYGFSKIKAYCININYYG